MFEFFRHGEAGVDLFFVISGFIIFYSVSVGKPTTRRRFAEARFWRIVPPYWVILTLYIMAGAVLSLLTGQSDRVIGSNHLAVSYLLLPIPGHVITIAWTLSLELMFYAVFAATGFGRNRSAFFWVMGGWVLLSQVAKHLVSPDPAIFGIILHTAVAEFLFGAMIARAYLGDERRWMRTALAAGSALMLAHLLGWIETSLGREWMPGLPAALIVYGILSIRWKMPRLVILWGEASYILYLLHILLYSVIGNLVAITLGDYVYGSAPAMLLMLAAAIVVSCLCAQYIERPYQRWYRARHLKT